MTRCSENGALIPHAIRATADLGGTGLLLWKRGCSASPDLDRLELDYRQMTRAAGALSKTGFEKSLRLLA